VCLQAQLQFTNPFTRTPYVQAGGRGCRLCCAYFDFAILSLMCLPNMAYSPVLMRLTLLTV
jgi:hypothetical protein